MKDKRIVEANIGVYHPYEGSIITGDEKELITLTDEEQKQINDLFLKFWALHQ